MWYFEMEIATEIHEFILCKYLIFKYLYSNS